MTWETFYVEELEKKIKVMSATIAEIEAFIGYSADANITLLDALKMYVEAQSEAKTNGEQNGN